MAGGALALLLLLTLLPLLAERALFFFWPFSTADTAAASVGGAPFVRGILEAPFHLEPSGLCKHVAPLLFALSHHLAEIASV